MARRPKVQNTPPPDPSPAYEVGYKHPPRETQFQKGQSGNPQGRPKGSNNFKADLAAELHEQVRITEGGTTKMLTKQQALIKRTVEQGCKGNLRAIEAVVKWVGISCEEEPDDGAWVPLSINDQDILARALALRAEAHHSQHEQGDES